MPILLDSSLVKTLTTGGVVTETNDSIAATDIQIDMMGGTITINFETGNPADNSFYFGAHRDTGYLTINTVTGQWQASTGAEGTLAPAQLAGINLNIKNARNGAEATASALGVILGTFVAWI